MVCDHVHSPLLQVAKTTTPNCLIGVDYHLELHVAITFLLTLPFLYRVSYIMLLDVHTNYVCSLSKNKTYPRSITQG
jgi:hypothetical protein